MRGSKFLVAGVITLMIGSTAIVLKPSPAAARNKVVAYNHIARTAYNVNQGYLYSNARLTKKVHNAKNFLNTTFYATKAASVKRTNGSRATYYYIANKSKSVKGWVWKGNLSKAKSYSKEKSDIKAMMAIVRTMSNDSQDDILADFKDISPKAAYYTSGPWEGSSLSTVVEDMRVSANYTGNNSDIQSIGKAYELFEGRFSSMTNSKLDTLFNRYKDALDTDNAADAASNLGDALADAVASLQ